MKIAVDAMGGEYAPQAIVEGTIQAAERVKAELVLVGDQSAIKRELKKYESSSTISIHPATQVIEMHDLPMIALRKKKRNSSFNFSNTLHLGVFGFKGNNISLAVSLISKLFPWTHQRVR